MTQDHQLFALGDVVLQSGQVLTDAKIAYKTYGERANAKRGTVVLPTFYTGNHRRNEGFFGSGRAIDPAKHFIISINLLGNSLSSSPSNTPPPMDGPRFPLVTLHDNVACQQRLIYQHLGLDRVHLVAGWSMAGCQAYHWASAFPDMVDAILPFCASARTSPHNGVFLEGIKAALCADGDWQQGDYKQQPARGLKAFARVYAGWAFSQTFYRQHLYKELGFANPEALLRDWEQDHLDHWDANNLLAKLASWQAADISACDTFAGDFTASLKAIRARAILMPCSDDLYFPPADNAFEAQHMPNAELRTFDSPWGHCVASPGNVPAFTQALDNNIMQLLSGA